nr:TetR family transcriptional regulator [Caballeronia sp. GAFFF1]
MKETGRSILENEGREALTALRVAESAGVAIGSLYEYFATMDALIGAVFDDYRNESRDELLAGIAALLPGATLFDGIPERDFAAAHAAARQSQFAQLDARLSG